MSKINETVGKYINEAAPRSISTIAAEIRQDWAKVNYGAKPYLDAMGSLDKITDKYYADSGSSVVAYFLANANQWKGEKARATKKELNKMLNDYYKSKGV